MRKHRCTFYDLDQCKVLEDTPAVPSLGKALRHGYTCECASGQKQRLTKQGKRFLRKTAKFRTPCCPWIAVKFWYQFVFYIAATGLVKYIFSRPGTERSDDQALGNWRQPENRNKKRDNDGASGIRLRDLPKCLEQITENLEETEVPAPRTHFS